MQYSLVGNVTVDQSENIILIFGLSSMSQYSDGTDFINLKSPFFDWFLKLKLFCETKCFSVQ